MFFYRQGREGKTLCVTLGDSFWFWRRGGVMLGWGMCAGWGVLSTPLQYMEGKRAGRAGLRELGVWAEAGALLGHAKAVRCAGTTPRC